MIISFSKDGYKEKPTIPSVTYEKREIEPKELNTMIRSGHVLSANFNASYPITQRSRTLSNFESIPYVMVDMDEDVKYELEVLVDSLSITPTIAYTTFSHGIKGSRFRLLYFFDKPITSIDTYKAIYSFICKECNLIDLKDNCGNNPVQACIGSKADCEYIFSDKIYDYNDFINEEKEYNELEKSNFEISGQIDYILKEEGSNIQSYCPVNISKDEETTFYDSTFLDDYFNLSYTDTLDKYRDKYEYLDKTPLPIVDADTPTITLPKNYVEIRRYTIKEAILSTEGKVKAYAYRVRKIRNGEGRRRKIYTATLLRKVMKPGISFAHLLYCALYDLYYFCFNADEPINRKQLFNVVDNAAKATPRESLIKRSRPRKKYVANPAYCQKHNVSKSKAVGISKHLEKVKKYDEIGRLYDKNLTKGKNLKKMKDAGLKVSSKDLQRYRKENNLPPLPREKRKTIKSDNTKSVKNKSAKAKSVEANPIDNKSLGTSDNEVIIMITHDSGKLLFEEAKEVIRKSKELQPELWAAPTQYLFPAAV